MQDFPRLHFAGNFLADTATLNNDPRQFNIHTFNATLDPPCYLNYTFPHCDWNPNGSSDFRFVNCFVKKVCYKDGKCSKYDALVGKRIIGSDDNVAAKMTDLDPYFQMYTAQLWGLVVGVEGAFQGKFKTNTVRDVWQRCKDEDYSGDPGTSGYWSSVLTNVTWMEEATGSKFINELRNLRIASVEAKGRAYMALVRPSLENASSVWDPHTAEQVSRVEAVQRRAASLVPAARCSRRTNHALKLQTIACKTNYYRLSFFPRTIQEWNELEPSVAEAEFKITSTTAVLHQNSGAVHGWMPAMKLTISIFLFLGLVWLTNAGYPRLHFAGNFLANTATLNNDPRQFNIHTFDATRDPPCYLNYTFPHCNWNPQGSGDFRFVNCFVKKVCYKDGMCSKRDILVGKRIIGSDDTVAGKMTDLDPFFQMYTAQLWGLVVGVEGAFQGKFKTNTVRDVWQ
ncbi:Hypp3131 [Branchiostoma lanceolatum]|uniref:Hypp3131 protein n=1 Tax=Branchiostoma lanceolatum TaxID=7740 RepID=A0A8K0EVW5_BRALA|nr:Hypp3131 [Branchiostoma lanceolatum]